MKNSNNRSLLEETKREADIIEAELAKHPELDDLEVTDAMDDALFQKIRAYEDGVEDSTEEAVPFKIEETEKTIPYRRKKRRKKIFIGLVAVLVMLIGLGVSSVGSKTYLKQVWDQRAGDEEVKVVQVEDMDAVGTEEEEEMTAYKEIYNQIGINVPIFRSQPEEMSLDRYEIDEESQSAILFYDYKGNLIRYYAYLNNQDSSWGVKSEDDKSDSYIIVVDDVKISIDEYKVENQEIPRYVAGFEYKGVHYQLKGMMEKAEFDKIIKNIYFL